MGDEVSVKVRKVIKNRDPGKSKLRVNIMKDTSVEIRGGDQVWRVSDNFQLMSRGAGCVQGFTLLFYLLAQGSGCNWMSALFGFKLWLQLVQNNRKVSVLIALKRTDVEFSDLVKSVVAPVRPEFR